MLEAAGGMNDSQSIHNVRQTSSRPLEGKVAIITGASRGIGATAARVFAQAGARVVLAARSEADLRRVVEDIKMTGGEAIAVATDVAEAASVENLVRRAADTFSRLDVAFNNAGTSIFKPFVEISAEEFDRVIAVNLKGVFLAMKYEIAAMLKTGGGAIVNMSSTAGLTGAPRIAPYVASKHGVVGLTKAAALEFARQNIRVNALAPSSTMTEKLAAQIEADPQTKARIISAIPLGRIASAEEVAQAALWLCSDAASFVTGVTLPVDGGRTAE